MQNVIRVFTFLISVGVAMSSRATDYPAPTEGDFTIRDFKFQSGETLPELRIHYRTLGKTGERRAGQNDQCRSDHARDNRQRRAIYSP